MTALKIIGIILLIFLLIGFLRVGALVSFGEELCVKLRVGVIKLTVIPGKEKKPKKPKEPKGKEPEDEKPKEKKAKKKPAFPRPTLEEILDLLRTAFSALGATVRRACKRVRIDPLDVTVVFGGDDPAYVAMAYGLVSGEMFRTMPKAEEKFYIPDPSLHLRMDFSAERTTAEGCVGVSLRVCDLFAILFTLAIPMLKWFLRFKKAHKHDAPAHKVPEKIVTETNDTEDKIA